MKKLFIILWIMLSCIFAHNASIYLTAEPFRAKSDSTERYACILTDGIYFYTSEQESSGVFILPKSYYVKVVATGKKFTQVEYLTDGEHTKVLRGYCLTEQLTFVDYIPVNPYLYATFSVIYTVEDGWAGDELIDKIELTCAYYGSYSIGSKQYAYVLQNGKYAYVPKPNDFTYTENTEYAERNAENTEVEESGNGIRIGILTVLCILVPLLAAMILQSGKRAPHPDDYEPY